MYIYLMQYRENHVRGICIVYHSSHYFCWNFTWLKWVFYWTHFVFYFYFILVSVTACDCIYIYVCVYIERIQYISKKICWSIDLRHRHRHRQAKCGHKKHHIKLIVYCICYKTEMYIVRTPFVLGWDLAVYWIYICCSVFVQFVLDFILFCVFIYRIHH